MKRWRVAVTNGDWHWMAFQCVSDTPLGAAVFLLDWISWDFLDGDAWGVVEVTEVD